MTAEQLQDISQSLILLFKTLHLELQRTEKIKDELEDSAICENVHKSGLEMSKSLGKYLISLLKLLRKTRAADWRHVFLFFFLSEQSKLLLSRPLSTPPTPSTL